MLILDEHEYLTAAEAAIYLETKNTLVKPSSLRSLAHKLRTGVQDETAVRLFNAALVYRTDALDWYAEQQHRPGPRRKHPQ